MAATSPRKRRKRIRLSSMETLGFFDTPTTSTSPSLDPVLGHTSGANSTAEWDDYPVQGLWESAELPSDTLLDWKPESASTRLSNSNFRWSVVILVGLVVAGIASAGYWIYRRPTNAAEIAVATVVEHATQLSKALDGLAPYADDLAGGTVDRNSSASALTLGVNETARSLFTASSSLPGS